VSISQLVAQHLPFLRRYARPLTGSQKSGDTYVAAVLEALIEEPQSFPGEYEPRVALYRAFTRVWNSLAGGSLSSSDPKGVGVEQRLTHLTPLTRQAFLLLGLEGFSKKTLQTFSASMSRSSGSISTKQAASLPPRSRRMC